MASAKVTPPREEPGLTSTPAGLSWARQLTPYLSGLIALIALAWAGELPYWFGFALYNEQALSAILALSLTLVFLGVSVRRPPESLPWYDWLAAALGLAAGVYVAVRYPVLAREFFFRPLETTVLAARGESRG